ncbi:cation:proton antiporter [Leucobacter komagatae]|uniref:NhaP-type Na+(K+)/H+ antiporter n=1 Tax=Leucobacter komagatae TaxID=55969 RepID=A0A0D0IQ33_9MICO|nr:sodium:proton antiporter [Leucobacter komagatae]KIP53137.1 NhaP-type Na+(K+)/H+ antiporter [Leucobacter komagatae]
MELALVAVAAVVVLVGVSLVSGRIGIAAPLVLVVVGIGIGYLPWVPLIEIDPEIILLGVLPPLLYAAAMNVPFVDFRRNLRPVADLSVLLVILSALLVGWILHLAVPVLPFPAAVALGAVISPPDAVAATSIGKRLGLPDRIVSILEGESLVNDATSLVLLRTALAAVSGSFVFWEAAGAFAFSVVAAIGVGLLMGFITVWIRARLNNPVHDTLVSFVVPFVAFIPAEVIGASGVLSVVVTGLYTGYHSVRRFSAVARTNERLNWRTVQFILENGVFLIMGLQLHVLVNQVTDSTFHLGHVALIAGGLVVLLIVSRALFVVPLVFLMRGETRRKRARGDELARVEARLARNGRANDERAQRRLKLLRDRAQADLDHEIEQQLGWRDGVVLTWSAMRGVVTLAAAQSISTDVPYRPQIILIAFVVAVATLLLHGLTLPAVINWLWPLGVKSGADNTEVAALSHDLVDAGISAIDDELTIESEDPERTITPEPVVQRAKIATKAALGPLALRFHETGALAVPTAETPAEAYMRLTRIALEAQRATLIEERAIGRYSSRALRAAGLALDAQEARIHPQFGEG